MTADHFGITVERVEEILAEVDSFNNGNC